MNTKWDKHDSQLKQNLQAVTLAHGEAPLHVSLVQMMEELPRRVLWHKAILLYVETLI